MAKIRPFRAQRFAPHAGELAHLVAPPYDVISSDGREHLGGLSPYNTVWLTLPESESDDRSKFVKYGRSSARLSAWRQDGYLTLDEEPCLYRYRQTFTDPVSGDQLTRESLVVLIKTEPYEKGVVLPHEETFPKHKEDRLRLLEATRTHLECIYGLYEDADGEVGRAVDGSEFEIVATVSTEDGIEHELARLCSPSQIGGIENALAPERVWIADGHHRYETAVAFRQANGGDEETAEDYMMIALSSMRDPGLILLPTHRILRDFPFSEVEVVEKLSDMFDIERPPNDELNDELRKRHSADSHVFGIAVHSGNGILATLRDPQAVKAGESSHSDLYKMLDVTILHETILRDTFGIAGTDKIAYTRDAAEAVSAVDEGPNVVSFMMNPPSIEDMRRIALGGEKMPQKSTYYYPKLLSGLVFWSMSDF